MNSKLPYSNYTREAANLLGHLIQLARKEKKMTQNDLAERAGISKNTLRKIERGNLHCEIGLTFEVAMLVGIKLFENDTSTVTQQLENTKHKIALLPQRIQQHKKRIQDDF